jgi:hypothetical protein
MTSSVIELFYMNADLLLTTNLYVHIPHLGRKQDNSQPSIYQQTQLDYSKCLVAIYPSDLSCHQPQRSHCVWGNAASMTQPSHWENLDEHSFLCSLVTSVVIS